ncbi:helix-turn-helix domain-containing protein [Thiocapsa bogorovii]|uniref:helix-turn-helix domain-containing protein n=1 Tax=Thiocapsa bogorovii TaxID=521689 RepID=UPI001E5431F0|nr:AraC family transcriptional regulator [Thiocapsa bogorovii]UHD16539.1 AraC family transcriptional regulator [Thiocapsa bogorovii]
MRLLAGHIYLRDWAFDSEASAMHLHAIMIPRHRLRAGAGMQEHAPRCYGELRGTDPRSTKIAEVAASWGFVDASAFSRRFRRRFGVSPSDVIGTALDRTEDAAVQADSTGVRPNRDYTDWLHHASGHEA